MTPWEHFFDQKIKLIAQKSRVLDVGGAQPFQKSLKKYQKNFRKTEFITIDFNHIYNPTITADIHHLPIQSNSIDGLICKAVLEHVYNPFQVVSEMYRVARKGAPILVYVPFLFHYHGNAQYKDYFRYTHDGLAELFKSWNDLEIQHVRGYFETLIYQLPFGIRKYAHLVRILDKKINNTKQVSGYYLFARK